MARDPDPSPAPYTGTSIWAWNGSEWEVVTVDSDGHLQVDITTMPTVAVTGTFWQTTQPVSGTVTVQQSTASNLKVDISGTGANATAIKVDNSGVTQPVSGTVAVSSVGGTVTVNGSGVTQPISGTVTVQQSTASNLKVDLSGTAVNSTAIKVDGSAVTQPVSGTFYQATQPISGTVVAQLNAYRSSDTSYQPARLDKATNIIQQISYEHHEIHAGSSFTCHYSQTSPTNTGEMTMIAFNTPDSTTYVHMFAEASSTAASTFTIYETADLDVDEGAQLTIYNRNRNSGTASTVTSIETSPVAGKATSYTVAQAAGASLSTTIPIYQKYLGAAAAGADTNGETRDTHELILKRNTQYAFVVASTTDDTNTHNIVLNWYEHADLA